MRRLQSSIPLALAALFMLPAAGRTAVSQPPISAVETRLDAVAAAYLAQNHFMGAVLVLDGDKVLLDRGYGAANLDWSIANAPAVKFRIGSVTKQFTAALVLLLAQDGKLALSDPVSKLVPDAPAAWSNVTVSQLLHHTSGIPEFTDDPRFPVWSASPRTPRDIVDLVAAKPLDFPSGSRFAYSNTNYEVLGEIIEKVSGVSYGALLESRLLDPLGMRDTGLDADDLILSHRALGYAENAGGWSYAHSESMTVPWAAGAMYSTTGDLARWTKALHGGKVVSPASLAEMTRAGLGDYGMGLEIGKHDGEAMIWHNGGIEGFHSYVSWLPARRLVIVILSNDQSAPDEIMGSQLIDVTEGRPVILPAERHTVAISPAELARFVGAFSFPDQPAPTKVDLENGHLVFGQRRRPLEYQGLRDGQPLYWDPARGMEVKFISDRSGKITAAVISTGDREEVGIRVPAEN
jgi:CubicO group peptidase (beta-lactamase class C family)